MTCVCDYSMVFHARNVFTKGPYTYCCPVGSTIINGACGCDSTGATKAYVATTTSPVVYNNNSLLQVSIF